MLKHLVYLAILTAVVVLSWLVLGIIHNFQTSTLTSTTQTQIIQIPDTFDTDTMAQIKKRQIVSVDLKQALSTISPSPTPSPSVSSLINPLNPLAEKSVATNSAGSINAQILIPTPSPTGSL